MDSANYQALLTKYLKGDCSDEERVLLEQWYASLDSEENTPVTEEEKQQLLLRNWAALHERVHQDRSVRRFWINPRWAAAALVFLLLGIGWYTIRVASPATTTRPTADTPTQTLFTEQLNTTTGPVAIRLIDGSRVTLQPGSKIRYPVAFAAHRRDVTLVGDAFFDVRRNPTQPFYVYTRDVVTRVLGTSFRVKALASERDVTVAVRTGRVSVYSPKLISEGKSKPDPETHGVVLTPNQQVWYLSQQQRLIKTLVKRPVILLPKEEQLAFTFRNASVADILKAIEKTYGVEIVYDEELMRHCAITTSLNQEDLYDKLTIICKLLGATYKVIDAQIVITGPGC